MLSIVTLAVMQPYRVVRVEHYNYSGLRLLNLKVKYASAALVACINKSILYLQ